MSDSPLPAWARSAGNRQSTPPRAASGSVLSGPGERRASAAGGRAPVRLSDLIPNVLGKALDQVAEEAFRKATREQLMGAAERMVAIDREKAIACSGILAWAAAGKDPELPTATPASLAWVYQASPEDLRRYAAEVVRLCPSVAGQLEAALHDALEEREDMEHVRARA